MAVVAIMIIVVTIAVAAMTVAVAIAIATGNTLCQFRALLDEKLRSAFRTDEDRVRVEPDVRIGLNVVRDLFFYAVDRLEMRRASRVSAADLGIGDVDQRIAGAVGSRSAFRPERSFRERGYRTGYGLP